jgi:hypothetical protein
MGKINPKREPELQECRYERIRQVVRQHEERSIRWYALMEILGFTSGWKQRFIERENVDG